jgi:hypothetical protein
MKNNENWGTKETMHFLSLSNEALRIENARLLSEVERLTNNIEVHDAEILNHNMDNQNKYITYLNYTLKN